MNNGLQRSVQASLTAAWQTPDALNTAKEAVGPFEGGSLYNSGTCYPAFKAYTLDMSC